MDTRSGGCALGKLGIGVYSPDLDVYGNSARGTSVATRWDGRKHHSSRRCRSPGPETLVAGPPRREVRRPDA
jgi:hypothetical protein